MVKKGVSSSIVQLKRTAQTYKAPPPPVLENVNAPPTDSNSPAFDSNPILMLSSLCLPLP